jgi:hypothetical protein
MKPEDPMENQAPVSNLLREWRVDAPLPPGFQDQVWRRIDRAVPREPAWLARVRQVVRAMTRPALAVSYLAVLLLAGLATGYIQAKAANARTDDRLSARYVQAVDPYQGLRQYQGAR